MRFIAQIAVTTWTRYTPLNFSVQQLQYKAKQYSAMQYKAVQHNTVQYNAMQISTDITAHKKNKISHLRLRNVLFFLSFSLFLFKTINYDQTSCILLLFFFTFIFLFIFDQYLVCTILYKQLNKLLKASHLRKICYLNLPIRHTTIFALIQFNSSCTLFPIQFFNHVFWTCLFSVL